MRASSADLLRAEKSEEFNRKTVSLLSCLTSNCGIYTIASLNALESSEIEPGKDKGWETLNENEREFISSILKFLRRMRSFLTMWK